MIVGTALGETGIGFSALQHKFWQLRNCCWSCLQEYVTAVATCRFVVAAPWLQACGCCFWECSYRRNTVFSPLLLFIAAMQLWKRLRERGRESVCLCLLAAFVSGFGLLLRLGCGWVWVVASGVFSAIARTLCVGRKKILRRKKNGVSRWPEWRLPPQGGADRLLRGG
jgi:hypothetical protein